MGKPFGLPIFAILRREGHKNREFRAFSKNNPTTEVTNEHIQREA
jgi:hypothetical protein